MNKQQWLALEQNAREQGVQSPLSFEAQALTDEQWESAQAWVYDLRRQFCLNIEWTVEPRSHTSL